MIRLISPHLTIYKPQFNSILSIFNRVTGIVLIFAYIFSCCFYESWIFFSPILYTVEFFLRLYTPFLLTSLGLFVSLAFFYHFIFGLEGFEEAIVRPSEYEKLDEYDLSQLYYLFNAKLVMVFFLSILSTSFLSQFFF